LREKCATRRDYQIAAFFLTADAATAKEIEDVWQAVLLLLLLGRSFLCRIAIDFCMKERKKERENKSTKD
jgi:hypothetical protein